MKQRTRMERIGWNSTHRRTVVWLIAVLSTLFLVGCQEQTPTPALPSPTPQPAAARTTVSGEPAVVVATPQPSPEPTSTATPTPEVAGGTVTLWHSWARADGDALNQILAHFAAENIHVQTLYVAYNDLPQAYADAVAAGGGPDLILAPAWWLRDLADAGALLPLSDLLQPGESKQWISAAVENLSIGGTLYGLPTNYELVSLYYNRALVTEEELPATTDDLLALVAADPIKGAGLYLNFYHLYWGLTAYGGALFDAEGRVVLDRTPGPAQFLAWLKRMDETPGNFVSSDYGMVLDRFKKGEFAFFVDGLWSRGELVQALGDNLGVVRLPAGPAGPAQPWLSGDGVFVNPVVEPAQQRLALELARHMAGGESGALLAQIAGRLPAHREAENPDPILAGFVAQGESAQAEPQRAQMSLVWGYAGDMLVKVIDGGMLPDGAVAETTALLNDALLAASDLD